MKNSLQNLNSLGLATMVLAAGLLMSVTGLAQSDAKKAVCRRSVFDNE